MNNAAPTIIPTSTKAEIHLDRLDRNVSAILGRLGEVELMAVVKANAYGHGSVQVARVLEKRGVSCLAVATVSEAVELRQAGIESDIVVFAPPVPDRAVMYAEYELQAVVDSEQSLHILESAGTRIPCHVKVDTGMSRLGVSVESASNLIRQVEKSSAAGLASIWTHFARADESDLSFTSLQFDRLLALVNALGGAPAPVHSAASAAMYAFPPSIDPSHMSMARIGIALYGLLDLPGARPPADLQPVMEFKTIVSAVKTVSEGTPVSYGGKWVAPSSRRIATISAGYADGVPRALSNRGRVRIGSRFYPITGTVCMDMFMVDLGLPDSEGREVQTGDEVVVFGASAPTCFEVADLCSSITYVHVCGISSRVPRVYSPERMP